MKEETDDGKHMTLYREFWARGKKNILIPKIPLPNWMKNK